jgi:hypothetical protein
LMVVCTSIPTAAIWEASQEHVREPGCTARTGNYNHG